MTSKWNSRATNTLLLKIYIYHYSLLVKVSGLTIVGHAHREALVESAVLALVAVLLLDFAIAFALVILQL